MHFLRALLTSSMLALVLAACAPAATVENCPMEDVIQRFTILGGEGGTYRSGDEMRYEFVLACPGFVRLVSAQGTLLFGTMRAQAGPNTLPPAGITRILSLREPFGREENTLVYSNTENLDDATIVDEATTWYQSAP
ncbi:MAG: hypothetical protein LC667_07490 [Thioalkalivibrio sp.]|nr:hypothetical protein [Thioalkalivibrio sp.]